MSPAFFADHCVPTAVVDRLRQAGDEVFLLRDHRPIASPDEHVIAESDRLSAVLISLDSDFADIVRFPPSQYRGIISLKVRNHPRLIPHIMSRLMVYLSQHPDPDHLSGKLVLVEPDIITIR